MKENLNSFFSFIKEDFKRLKMISFFILLICLIWFNYTVDFEDSYLDLYNNSIVGTLYYFLFYMFVLIASTMCVKPFGNIKSIFSQRSFWVYTVFSMFLLALYQSQNPIKILWENASQNYFFYKLTSQLDSLIIAFFMVFSLGVLIGKSRFKLYGLLEFKFNSKIYFIFLALMIPLLLWAATQPDFLKVYPKLTYSRFPVHEYFSKFSIYEPFYLLNFIGIEWFFRGFLILAFLKYFNKNTVIIIAALYCVFHFGKPLAECVSSFFGGYLLGYMVYKTKTIWGGVIVHMGIAFLMDVFAILSIQYL